MRQAKAFVSICPHRPDLLGHPLLGHVGWGYEYPDGQWCVGAVEGDKWRGGINGFWAVRMPNLQAALNYLARMRQQNAEYDYYKLLTVTPGVVPNPRYADQIVNWVAREPYALLGRNCMNSTFDVLMAFSNGQYNNSILPHPNQKWIPNDWFNHIHTPDYYQLPGANLLMDKSMDIVEPFALDAEVVAPSWRVEGGEFVLVNRTGEKNIPEVKVAPPVGEMGG